MSNNNNGNTNDNERWRSLPSFPPAAQPDVLLCSQRDSHYLDSITDQLMEVWDSLLAPGEVSVKMRFFILFCRTPPLPPRSNFFFL